MPDEKPSEPLNVFQDGYSCGIKLPGLDEKDECPIAETDDPVYAEWRRGWLAGQEFRRSQIGS